jgi:hypothetical protein
MKLHAKLEIGFALANYLWLRLWSALCVTFYSYRSCGDVYQGPPDLCWLG